MWIEILKSFKLETRLAVENQATAVIQTQTQHAVRTQHQRICRQDRIAQVGRTQFTISGDGDRAPHLLDDPDPLDRQAERQQP